MEFLDLLSALDAVTSVIVLLWVGWRIEIFWGEQADKMWEHIDRLTDCDDDET